MTAGTGQPERSARVAVHRDRATWTLQGLLSLWPLLVMVGASLTLLARIAPDVESEALYGDESLAGLIAVRPLPEVVWTVLWERGGAPLHFVLAHFALLLDPSPEALRWLSVVFAVATVPLSYELARRLAGDVAAATAAVVVATSGTLGVYGSFGRMHALFAFAAALAAVLFVRALELRTARAALVAAAAAWLLPASHTYGAIPVLAMAVVGLALWRGRPLRPALPVLAVALAMVPFALADLRITESLDEVGVAAGTSDAVLPLGSIAVYAFETFASFAGGESWYFVPFLALYLIGLVVLARRRPPFAVFAVLAIAVPFLALTLAQAENHPTLRVRHLIYALPLAAAFAGAGVQWLVRSRRTAVAVAAVALVTVLAVLAPAGGDPDPREEAAGEQRTLRPAAAWVSERVTERDVLYPYSPVYFAALPETRDATILTSRGRGDIIKQGLERVEMPVRAVFVAAPVGALPVDRGRMREFLGPDDAVAAFGPWVVVEARGPFATDGELLRAAADAVVAIRAGTGWREPDFTWFEPLCLGLQALEASCPRFEP
jgi:hypothetical protein